MAVLPNTTRCCLSVFASYSLFVFFFFASPLPPTVYCAHRNWAKPSIPAAFGDEIFWRAGHSFEVRSTKTADNELNWISAVWWSVGRPGFSRRKGGRNVVLRDFRLQASQLQLGTNDDDVKSIWECTSAFFFFRDRPRGLIKWTNAKLDRRNWPRPRNGPFQISLSNE